MRDWINLLEHGLLNLPRGGTRTEVLTNPHIRNNPQFEAWFSGSKVCDKDGNPIVCYHGTFFEFTKFRHEDKGWGMAGSGFNRLGFWFDVDPGVPNWLAGREDGDEDSGHVYACYLSIKNPFALDSEWLWDEDRQKVLDLREKIKPLQDIYYYAERDDFGNKRTPDGKYFDEQAYHKLTKELDRLLDSLTKGREDGFYRLMKALPKGVKSSTEEVIEFQEQLIAEGYDGIWLGDTTADFGARNYKVTDWWLAFHPNQIKLISSQSFTDSDHINENNN